ncbi:MAG: phage portal protein [Planctomycetota bacterium]|jgi:hypothetical protein
MESRNMGFDLAVFGESQLDSNYLEWLINERVVDIQNHFGRLWDYYTNPVIDINFSGISGRKLSELGRCYVQAQEYGLPCRITGFTHSADVGLSGARAVEDIQRKEVVIENDIAWRVNAAVDFLFGKPISFASKSPDRTKRAEIEAILKALFSSNGGVGFFQDMAVLGSVYGFVDCLVRPDNEIIGHFNSSPSHPLSFEDVLTMAQKIDLELIDAPRALPILDENDYRKIRYYVQHFYQNRNTVSTKGSFVSRLLRRDKKGTGSNYQRDGAWVTEITSADARQRYENGQLAAEDKMKWGFLPVVHIQNMVQPFYYEGISDVEPLVPLQDELNTRLSDRASRITFQSFKMYLGKGIEGFEDRPVSPGRMWYTDNPEAAIEEFGGDIKAPSEDMHIAEIREAMDKTSGVTPLVAGVLRSKLGNLTSAVALKLTLMGMLSKTQRKRFTYGEGLKKISSMALEILNKAGIYRTNRMDREIDIIFPSPLPENVMEKLKEAQIKKELGVPPEQVLRELGYETKYEETNSNESD